MKMNHVLLIVLLGSVIGLIPGVASVAQAQMVINPNTVEFIPSDEHNATLSDGTAKVTRYELRLYLKGAAQPFSAADLGKPTPVNDLIVATNPAWFVAGAMGQESVARVAAIGPAGEGLSDESNPFVRLAAPPKPGAPVLTKR